MNPERVAVLRGLWGELESGPPGGRDYRARRAEIDAPIAIYAAVRERDGARAILFESDLVSAPRARTRFWGEGISISDQREQSAGLFRMVVTLEDAVFSGLFEVLCADLIDVAVPLPNEGSAVPALGQRLEAWMTFLRKRASGLSEEEVLGLIGELLCLRMIADRTGWTRAIAAWLGPDGGLHDFMDHGIAFEVKASLGVGSGIWINNLDQLDDHGLARLLLVQIRLGHDAAGVSLAGLVSSTRSVIHAELPTALLDFERKLLAVGFLDHDAGRYAEPMVRLISTSFFEVTQGFPRLTRGTVPTAVSEARYQLQTADLGHHLISESNATIAMTDLGGGR